MVGQRTVVKHSYLTGKAKGAARAQAHVRYIQFRGGKDKDEEARSFFSSLRDDVHGREVSAAVYGQDPRGTIMHKLILSPGVQGADVKEYCREVMADLGSRKGLDLEWYAVQHDNTDNPHVHIVVMGRDENGRNVRLAKKDYTKIKEAGDKYLERNRHLDREEKERDTEKDRERSEQRLNPVSKFVNALKAAAREFSRAMERDLGEEKKPETKFEQRRREKEEERQHEIAALGETIDLDEYLAKQAAQEEREEARKAQAWKEYCRPIEIDRGANEPIVYSRASSLASLRALEKDYRDEDPTVCEMMTEADSKRLNDWIKEKYRDEKRIEKKAERLESIDVELDSETNGKWSATSSLEDLRKLDAMNDRGEVYLDDSERKALGKWIKDQEQREPIRIEIEPGSEPIVYDLEDSKESLQFLAREYANGSQWAQENISRDDYRKVKGWISEKDRLEDEKNKNEPIEKFYWDEGAGDGQTLAWGRDSSLEELRAVAKYIQKNPDKEFTAKEQKRIEGWLEEKEERAERAVSVGAKEDGKGSYVGPEMDQDALKAAREELTKSPEENKEAVARLDKWINAKEKQEQKDPEKGHRRRKTAREKLMERSVGRDRAERWNNYYKEKAEQKDRLEGQRENLKAQKRALNKYEKERETVDGQYSEIWGADKSGIAAGPMGAASGGLRPLGANQFVKLLQQASKNEELKRKTSEMREVTVQKALDWKQEADAKKAPKDDKGAETKLAEVEKGKSLEATKEARVSREDTPTKEPAAIDNGALEADTRELGKEIKNKKQKEDARDQRPATDPDKGEREDPFKYDPWGRY